jgi:hypothetical protein
MHRMQAGRIRVYVDAKITGMHDRGLPKQAYVGYSVEGMNLQDVRMIDSVETDDAEIQAILFATEELKPRFDAITIVCDHQSVVSEAKKKIVHKPSPLLVKLRNLLDADPLIELVAIETNSAHAMLTEYVNNQILTDMS